jgi:hypothetical protein
MTDKISSPSCRSLNAMVTESKKCPFGVNTTIQLKKSDNSGKWWGVF